MKTRGLAWTWSCLLIFCFCLWWSQPAAAAPPAETWAAPLIPEPQPVQIYIYRHRLWVAPAVGLPSGSSRGSLPTAALARPPRGRLAPLIAKYARKYGLDPRLVELVIRQESGFNPAAVSPKGALGLMQLMPATAAELGVTDPFDVEQNLAGGIRYLKSCLDRFQGDLTLALAAYNAGPNRVAAQGGVPAIPETQVYVAAILGAYQGGSFPGAKMLPTRNFPILLPQPPLPARWAFKKVRVQGLPEGN